MKKQGVGYWICGTACFVCLLLGMCLAFGATTNVREALAFLLFSVGFGFAAVVMQIMPLEDNSQPHPFSFTTILLSIVMLCIAASKMWSTGMVYGVLKAIGLTVVIGIIIYFVFSATRKAKK